MLKSTGHFIEKLNKFNPSNQNAMVCFNVVFLFTNPPLVEAIDIIISRLYDERARFGCSNPEVLIALGVLVSLLYCHIYNNATRDNYIRRQ